MLSQIAAHTGRCLSTSACLKATKILWRRFSRDDSDLAGAVVGGRPARVRMTGSSVCVPRTRSKSATPLTTLTVRQTTAEGVWHPSRQTDLLCFLDIGTGWNAMVQAPPGFPVQLILPAGTYRIAAVRLASASRLLQAPVLGLAAATTRPFEQLPRRWADPDVMPTFLHNDPVTAAGPAFVDLVFLVPGAYGPPPRYRELLAQPSPRAA